MYGTSNHTITIHSGPWTIVTQGTSLWSGTNYPIEVRRSKRLTRFDKNLAEFGEKVALARYENIIWARRLIAEQDWWLRRIGTPVLAGLPRLVQRRGRVCGESNYYRAMLC